VEQRDALEVFSVAESDVFSFGLILSELIDNLSVFPKRLSEQAVQMAFVLSKWELDIPNSVLLAKQWLICDC
jgi:hypothetical protein